MKQEDVALELIKAIGGELTEKNIKGVCTVFNGIKEMVDNNWEDYIAKKTTDVLAYDNITCDCSRKIKILRSRQELIYLIQ